MKIEELLESPQDKEGIEKAAESIFRHIRMNYTGWSFAFSLRDVPGLGRHWQRIRNLTINVIPTENRSSTGSYNSSLKTITIYVTSPEEWDTIFTTIVHELRHAIDGSLSGGRYMDRSRPYLSSQHEINARFTEVLVKIDRELRRSVVSGRPMSIEEYMKEFEIEAAKNNLIKIFDGLDDNSALNLLSVLDDEMRLFGNRVNVRNVIQNAKGRVRLIGKVGDPRYRRLIKRLIANYEYVIRRTR